MTKIFISYSRKDIAFIEQLAEDLKVAGIESWYDLSGLEGGSRWSREIEGAIKGSEYVIIVLSPYSAASEWVEEEILYARNQRKKIIPLLYKTCEIPLGFHTLNFIDVRGNRYRENYAEILRALNHKNEEKDHPSLKSKMLSRIFYWFGGLIFLILGVMLLSSLDNTLFNPMPTHVNTRTLEIDTLPQNTVEPSATTTPKLTSTYRSRVEFFIDEDYGEYIKSVIQPDMRVRAISKYKIVEKGMVGTFFSLSYSEEVCWIIWDDRMNAKLNPYLIPLGLPSDKYAYTYDVPCYQIEIIQ